MVTIESITNTIESGSRPQGGVGHLVSGAYSLGGEHIDNSNGQLNLTTPKYVPFEFYNNAYRGKLLKNDVLICKDGALTGKVAIVRNELDGIQAMINEHVFILRCDDINTQKYLFIFLYSEKGQVLLKDNITGAAQGGLNSTNLKNIKIPLPPLSVQQQIVAECEEVDKEYNASRMSIEEYRRKIAQVFENLQVISGGKPLKINELCVIQKGTSITSKHIKKGNIKVVAGGVDFAYYHNQANRKANVITVSASGANAGFVNLWKEAIFASDCTTLQCKTTTETFYTYYYLKNIQEKIFQLQKGAAQPHVYAEDIKNIEIPIPPLSVQQQVVSEIEGYEAEIAKAKAVMDGSAVRKEEILKKYLQ